MAKDVDDEKGEKLIFGGDKAGCDWVAVKIPVHYRKEEIWRPALGVGDGHR